MEQPEHKVDRTGWPPGPWDDEPDRIEWRSDGLPCLIVRNRWGALCGYVAVSDGHPWFGEDYNALPALEVHGGLTYTGSCADHICHAPAEGEPDHVWWIGFDCAHSMDLAPRLRAQLSELSFKPDDWPDYEIYRDVAYVRAEVERLATMAREVA